MMGKILDLLNEFDPYIANDGEHMDNIWFFAYLGQSAIYDRKKAESIIISKNYRFIEWLCKNKKIDEEKFVWFLYDEHYLSKLDDAIICWLAISDKPIEDLVSILK